MVFEVKESTQFDLTDLLEKIKKQHKGEKKKTLAKHFGCLKRGIDGLEYQKTVRYGTD